MNVSMRKEKEKMQIGNKKVRWGSALFILLAALALSVWRGHGAQAQDAAAAEQPNILFLVVDDMGYSDIGPFGSEIETPNLDALADGGMTFTNFHTSGSCSPSRSMMLTGVDNHRNGLGTMDHRIGNTPTQQGHPGYVGYLNEKVVTIATMLRDAGYHTYQAGKWHLGEEEHQLPRGRGFEQHFTMVPGGGSHYDRQEYWITPRLARYNENGVDIETLPDDFYSTKTFTDKVMEYIDADRGDDKPFFAYVAYTAPHAPIQAPAEYIEKYMGRYDEGWDVLRAERFERMKEMGLIPDYLELPPRWHEIPAWSELSPQDQRYEAKRMAVYAAMIDYIDFTVGRWVDYLKEIDEYENTIIVFISDNGADEHDNIGRGIFTWVEEAGYNNSYENLGLASSFQSLAGGWAQVSATPFYGAKGVMTEGGIRGPLIVHYPNGIEPGTQTDAFASVLDLTPTWLEYAGVEAPGTEYNGQEIFPVDGRSIRPLWDGTATDVYGPEEPIGFELYGTVNKALFMGDWKILRVGDRPWGNGPAEEWKLYNLRIDPRELVDLAALYPAQLEKMIAAYRAYEEDVQFISVRPKPIPFDTGRWVIEAKESAIVEYAGQNALMLTGGSAIIPDADFSDGVIEFDMAIEEERGYAGALFHIQDSNNHERFYVLPARSGMPNANQYEPLVNGLESWQLYYGTGFNGVGDYPIGEWFHIKIVVAGDRASFYVITQNDPVIITTLKLGAQSGGVGLFTQPEAPFTTAYFANFSYTPSTIPARLGAASAEETVPGTVTTWDVSQPFPADLLAEKLELTADDSAAWTWTTVESEPSGLVNLGKLQGIEEGKNTVVAKVTLNADEAQIKALKLGYSDSARVYFNGKLIFSGDNAFRSRDFNFIGAIGYGETVYLPLEAGANELLVAVTENFGGWGVQARFEDMSGVSVE
jgi:arylsulfatase A-like enzyme